MNKIIFIFKSLTDLIKYLIYKILFIISGKKEMDVWLISERGIDARDNGYFFYKYLKKEHPEIKIKYVISKESSDYFKIDKEDIIEYRSKEHYLYFLYSKYLISAEIMGFSPNEQLFYRLNKNGFLKLKGKNIFLQHGITKDYNSYMDPQKTKLDLFICAALPEKQYMIDKYGYDEQQVKLTGFARFDSLKDESEKIILIMPTWRKWLKYVASLKNTRFYEMYKSIFEDKSINNILEEKKYKIIFFPHIIFQKFIKDFCEFDNKNVIIADFKNYNVQDLLKKSKLLITDYSSVAFDFAYMKKNTIYYQFDLKEYRNIQYAEGYYNYEKNGFGPVCYNYESLKENIVNFLTGTENFEKYDKRIVDFFKYTDTRNCERIFNEIQML